MVFRGGGGLTPKQVVYTICVSLSEGYLVQIFAFPGVNKFNTCVPAAGTNQILAQLKE